MEQDILNAGNGGLSVYLFATLIKKAAGVDLGAIRGEQFPWATAGEFMDKWSELKTSATKDITAIVFDEKPTVAEKLERIGYYGILAVPALSELEADSSLSAQLKTGIRSQLKALDVTNGADTAAIADLLAN